MSISRTSDAEYGDAEHDEIEYYLPATARLSTDPGRLERVLKTIFRRRGEVPFFVRRDR